MNEGEEIDQIIAETLDFIKSMMDKYSIGQLNIIIIQLASDIIVQGIKVF